MMAVVRIGNGRGVARIILPAFVLILAACGSSGRTSGSPSTSVPSTAAGGSATSVGSNPSAASVSVAAPGGYQYRAVLDSKGVTTAIVFTTDDGSGSGGTPVDAPPGHELVVATLRITNTADRPEPFVLEPFVGGAPGPLPFQPGAGEQDMMLAVPEAHAAAFGIQGDQGSACTPDSTVPSGYCDLNASVGAYSPAAPGSGPYPQLAPGSSATVTLVVAGGGLHGQWVPSNAPLQTVKVFIRNCSDSTTCWAALN